VSNSSSTGPLLNMECSTDHRLSEVALLLRTGEGGLGLAKDVALVLDLKVIEIYALLTPDGMFTLSALF
jgi:hypothetical protein